MSYKKAPENPNYEIDWSFVEMLIVKGSTGVQVAGRLGIPPATLYDRCAIENNSGFSAYAQSKRARGESYLCERQFDKAMGITEKGNDKMLLRLGEWRLGQGNGKNTPKESNVSNLADLKKSIELGEVSQIDNI